MFKCRLRIGFPLGGFSFCFFAFLGGLRGVVSRDKWQYIIKLRKGLSTYIPLSITCSNPLHILLVISELKLKHTTPSNRNFNNTGINQLIRQLDNHCIAAFRNEEIDCDREEFALQGYY